MGMNVVIFGLAITSSWGNEHAASYRSLVKGLASRGHDVLFLERDIASHGTHRDLPVPPYCTVDLYTSVADVFVRRAAAIANADLVIVGSSVADGAAIIERLVPLVQGCLAFYDIDTPATVMSLAAGGTSHLETHQVPLFDVYLSRIGGSILERLEHEWGSPRARVLYGAVDPEMYAPLIASPVVDLGYLGTYSADRQSTLDEFLFEPARRWPEGRFALAVAHYPKDRRLPDNVTQIAHLPPGAHTRFYGRSRFALSVTPDDLLTNGYAPSAGLFEAAACGTPIISDQWEGLDDLFVPNEEILVARSSREVVQLLTEMSEAERLAIGQRARKRVLSAHTGMHRALELEAYVDEVIGSRRMFVTPQSLPQLARTPA